MDTEVEPDSFADMFALEARDGDCFVAPDPTIPGAPRVFGGLIMAQAMMAAGRTAEGFVPHSQFTTFYRVGAPTERLAFRVERVRDGRLYATRRVTVMQGDRTIAESTVDLEGDVEGLSNQSEVTAQPAKEDYPVFVPLPPGMAQRLSPPEIERWQARVPLTIRGAFRAPDVAGGPRFERWTCPKRPLPADPVLYAAVMAQASDGPPIGMVATYHRFPADPKYGLTVNQVMWWHQPPRTGWMRYVSDSPTIQRGRAFIRTSIYGEDGALLATAEQQALFRD